MKVKREVEVMQCDICKGFDGWHSCADCGIDICWRCLEKPGTGTVMRHSMHCQGSGDLMYCQSCYVNNLLIKPSPMFRTYLAISRLRERYDKFLDNTNDQAKKLESKAKKYYEQHQRILNTSTKSKATTKANKGNTRTSRST